MLFPLIENTDTTRELVEKFNQHSQLHNQNEVCFQAVISGTSVNEVKIIPAMPGRQFIPTGPVLLLVEDVELSDPNPIGPSLAIASPIQSQNLLSPTATGLTAFRRVGVFEPTPPLLAKPLIEQYVVQITEPSVNLATLDLRVFLRGIII